MTRFNVFKENIGTNEKVMLAENKTEDNANAIIGFSVIRNDDFLTIFYAEEIKNETN